MKKILLAAGFATACIFAAPANAQPVYNWTGFYVGLQGGRSFDAMAGLRLDVDSNTHLRGYSGGAQWGSYWQNGNSIYGFNLNYNFSNIEGSKDLGGELYSGKISSFGTLEGRLGMPIFTPNTMIFASGGLAFGQLKGQVITGGTTFRDSNYATGFTVGGGIQTAIDQRSSFYIQYKFMDFGAKTFALDDAEKVYFRAGLLEIGYEFRY